MKKFLIYLFKIFGIVAVLMFTADLLYTYAYQNGVPRNKVRKILQLNNAHYDYAFFGSSRTENHIDCELIEKLTGKSCINLGIAGATIGDMLVLMKLANAKGVTFDNTILQIDYGYNSSGLSNNFKASLVPFVNKSHMVKESLEKESDFSFYQMPFYRYMKYDKVVGFREVFATFYKKRPSTNLDHGFTPKKGFGLNNAGKIPENFNQRNSEIESIIELNNKLDSNLIFFTAPFCQYIENRESFEKLRSRLPNLYNYSVIFDNNDEYFYNCGHLNIDGSREFTKILIEDLIKSKRSLL